MLSDPGETSALGPLPRFDVAFRLFNSVGSRENSNFGAQSHGPPTRCLRFAGWVAPPPRKTRFRMAGQPFRAGVATRRALTKGFRSPILLSQALPGALNNYRKLVQAPANPVVGRVNNQIAVFMMTLCGEKNEETIDGGRGSYGFFILRGCPRATPPPSWYAALACDSARSWPPVPCRSACLLLVAVSVETPATVDTRGGFYSKSERLYSQLFCKLRTRSRPSA